MFQLRLLRLGQVFAGQVVADAIVDGLLHDATVLKIRGHSHRMRAYQEPTTRKGGPLWLDDFCRQGTLHYS